MKPKYGAVSDAARAAIRKRKEAERNDCAAKAKTGPKPLPAGDRKEVVAVRLAADHRAKFAQLGGGDWLRTVLDATSIGRRGAK